MLAGMKARGAGTQEGVTNVPSFVTRSLSSHSFGTIQSYLNGAPCCGRAYAIIHNLHAVLASSALLDSSKDCCLCCAECWFLTDYGICTSLNGGLFIYIFFRYENV